MTNDEILLRIARTLKQEVGPAVAAEYPKTQAFMAAVVLERLGRQIGLERAHAAATAADLTALLDDLHARLAAAAAPPAVTAAVQALTATRDQAALCRVIEALYAARGELGEARFGALLGRIRRTLRASINRQMAYAG